MTGREFEKYMVDWLNEKGFWVHRMAESNTGSQPFDIIALKKYGVFALDCKVISTKRPYFPFSRVEENQKLAFDKLIKCYKNNLTVGFMIYYEGDIYFLNYHLFKVLSDVDKKKGYKLTESSRIENLESYFL